MDQPALVDHRHRLGDLNPPQATLMRAERPRDAALTSRIQILAVGMGAAILFGTLPFDAGVPTTAGRLAGLPVLVAHGDTDTVIPRDLLERTWTYLHGDAGSTTTGVRDPGGHGLSLDVAAQL